MAISNHVKRGTDSGDFDREWDTDFIKGGILEITVNTSPARTKMLPHNSAMLDLYNAGDVVEVIVINSGANEFELLPNSGAFDLLFGNPVVPAGEFRTLKMVVNYISGTMGIFCS